MIFTSLEFLLFFTAAVFIHFALPYRFRWIFLLAASYFFYFCYEPRYVAVLFSVTAVVYLTAMAMDGRSPRTKKLIITTGLVANLGILFFFKYFNFFTMTAIDVAAFFGRTVTLPKLQTILPWTVVSAVGISFYTFQAIGYTIDVYRGTRGPERNPAKLALFVSFFPLLFSGPIERSTRLLPQFFKKIDFDYDKAVEGVLLMAWGFFQKLIIADRLFVYVSMVYDTKGALDPNNVFHITGLPLLVATFFFSIQILCDFSAYSDIAIGAAKIMGYEVMPNFRQPFLARTLSDLWRRWHMSLILWLRDYLYIPLGGNRVGRLRRYFNTLVVFTISGFWHGAQWTLVTWGFLNGVIIVLSNLTDRPRTYLREKAVRLLTHVHWLFCVILSFALVMAGALGIARAGLKLSMTLSLIFIALGAAAGVLAYFRKTGRSADGFAAWTVRIWQTVITVFLFMLGAVFFRARTMADAWYVLTHFTLGSRMPVNLLVAPDQFAMMFAVIALMFIVHIIQESGIKIGEAIRRRPAPIRWSAYYAFIIMLFLFMQKSAPFIYFQY